MGFYVFVISLADENINSASLNCSMSEGKKGRFGFMFSVYLFVITCKFN